MAISQNYKFLGNFKRKIILQYFFFLNRIIKFWNIVQIINMIKQKQPPEVFYKKAVLTNFGTVTGKNLCWSLFLIKFQAFGPATLTKLETLTQVLSCVDIAKFVRTPILKNISERLLMKKTLKNSHHPIGASSLLTLNMKSLQFYRRKSHCL